MKKIVCFIAGLTYAVLLAGCVTMQTRWMEAESANTIEAYERFLTAYPDSPYATLACGKLESLRYAVAIRQDTIHSYESFLLDYPTGEFSKLAIQRRDNKIAEIRQYPLRTISLEQEQREQTTELLVLKLKGILGDIGLKIIETTETPADAVIKISRLGSGIPKGEVVGFALSGGGVATPTAYAYFVRLNLTHKDIGTLLDDEIWGGSVGQFLGIGPDPESDRAKELRKKSLAESVLRKICRILVNYFGPERFQEAVPVLIGGLNSDDLILLQTRVLLLELIGSRTAVPTLSELLKHPNYGVRYAALNALRVIKDERAVPELLIWMEEKHCPDYYREKIADALREITEENYGTDIGKWHGWWEQKNTLLPRR